MHSQTVSTFTTGKPFARFGGLRSREVLVPHREQFAVRLRS